MPNYRRLYVPGGTYFFTVVTHLRSPIFANASWRKTLGEAIRKIQAKRPFRVDAIVLLPDHLHSVWSLPEGDANYSTRWRRIKEEFTREFLKLGGVEGDRNDSRIERDERGVWQRRFWEHCCEDSDDMNGCLDYCHWNPVKHGLVQRVQDYPYSSFHRYVKEGIYPLNWGAADPCPGYDDPEWE